MIVSLREVLESDLPIFFENQRDEVAVRMAEFASRDREAFDAHWARILADPTLMVKAILIDGTLAGNVVAFDRAGQRLIGYWIGREHWGRGVATKALAAFVAGIDTRPLFAFVAKHNVASIRVLEKCGFKAVAEVIGDVDEWIMRLGGAADGS